MNLIYLAIILAFNILLGILLAVEKKTYKTLMLLGHKASFLIIVIAVSRNFFNLQEKSLLSSISYGIALITFALLAGSGGLMSSSKKHIEVRRLVHIGASLLFIISLYPLYAM